MPRLEVRSQDARHNHEQSSHHGNHYPPPLSGDAPKPNRGQETRHNRLERAARLDSADNLTLIPTTCLYHASWSSYQRLPGLGRAPEFVLKGEDPLSRSAGNDGTRIQRNNEPVETLLPSPA